MEHILITGGNGYLGSKLIPILLPKYNITVLKRTHSNTQRILNFPVNFINIDDKDFELKFALLKFNIILHLATNYNAHKGQISDLEILNSNYYLPQKLLLLAIENKVKTFINTDTVLSKLVNYYSFTKSQFKESLKFYQNCINCLNIRLEQFYGENDNESRFITYIMKKFITQSTEIDVTKGEQIKNFIYIDDVIDCYLKIIEFSTINHHKYHEIDIGSKMQTSIYNLVMKIKNICGNTTTKINFGALPYREHEVMISQLNLNFIESLGWKEKYNLHSGLKKMYEIEKLNNK